MKIKFFSNFCGSDEAKKIFEDYCMTDTLSWYGKDVFITTDDTYTHAVILNTAMPNLTIKKENVIGLAWEPLNFLGLTHEFVQYASKHIGRYFIGDVMDLPAPFEQRYSYMWYIPPPKKLYLKDRVMSIAISDKKNTDNQRYRHQIVRYILDNNIPVNIYGGGCKLYSDTESKLLMGPFDRFSIPYETHLFSICIENFTSAEYSSEKVFNPLMCGCTPIYLGSPNIEQYTGDTIIRMNGDISHDMNLIVSILKTPSLFLKKINPETIEEKVNFFKNLDTIFSS